MRGIEEALTSGIKFSNSMARKLIHLMKEAGMLCDAQEGEKEVLKQLNDILHNLSRS
jgi:hypothetical protein